MRPKTNRELEDRCINTIRILSADAVQNANSGHPGMPMGAGFGNGVGMAIAEAWLASRYNRPGHEIVDHRTDGDLMEGISQEAASLAGHLRLGKLIYPDGQNHVSLAGATGIDFTEDVAKRFDADGYTLAIQEAQAEDRRLSLILARTHIAHGSPSHQIRRT
jgi:transketolase